MCDNQSLGAVYLSVRTCLLIMMTYRENIVLPAPETIIGLYGLAGLADRERVANFGASDLLTISKMSE